MERTINVFDKISEEYITSITLENCEHILKKIFKKELVEDPDLIYEYEINVNVQKEIEEILKKKLDFNKYCYFLSCSQ